MLVYRSEPDSDGNRTVVCDQCGKTRVTNLPVERIRHLCPKRKPGHGPGTHLALMINQMGIKAEGTCACFEKQVRMDYLGSAGCRREWNELYDHLRMAYKSADIATKAGALKRALHYGLPLTISGLLEEAIRRAEEDGQ